MTQHQQQTGEDVSSSPTRWRSEEPSIWTRLQTPPRMNYALNFPDDHRMGRSSHMQSLYFVRGPLLIFGAVVACAWPYRDYLSRTVTDYIHIWRCLGISMLGFVLLGVDIWHWFVCTSRRRIRELIQCVAADDILRRIHDPTTGIVATIVGGFVGASAMYALRMDENQRIEVVKSVFGLGDDEARTILMEKGGYARMFPDSLQEWLQLKVDPQNFPGMNRDADRFLQNQSKEDEAITKSSPPFSGETAESSDVDSIGFDLSDMETSAQSSSLPSTYRLVQTAGEPIEIHSDSQVPDSDFRNGHGTKKFQRKTRHQQEHLGPLITFLKIVRDIALEQMKPPIANLPVATFEKVGTAALIGLGIQFLLRRNATKKSRALDAVCAIALSSLTSLSFGSILAREVVLGRIYNKSALQVSCQQMVLRLWHNVRSNVIANKTRSALAFLVLYFVGRRKRWNDT